MYYRQQIDRMGAPTLGAKWYEKLWSGLTTTGGDILDIYGKSKQTEAYQQALTTLTTQKAVDYSKYLIIGGFAIAAVVILTRKKN
jgi:hypothetical protein